MTDCEVEDTVMEQLDTLFIKARGIMKDILFKSPLSRDMTFFSYKIDKGILYSVLNQIRKSLDISIKINNPRLYYRLVGGSVFCMGACIAYLQLEHKTSVIDIPDEVIKEELEHLFETSFPQRFTVAFKNSVIVKNTDDLAAIVSEYVDTIYPKFIEELNDECRERTLMEVLYGAGATLVMMNNREADEWTELSNSFFIV